MKTINSHSLSSDRIPAGSIASTSPSTEDSFSLMQSVPQYSTSSFLLLVIILGVGGVLVSTLASAIKVANEWERLVVLRLGKFLALKDQDSLQLGGLAGMTAMTMGMGQEQMPKEPENAIENHSVNGSAGV